MSAMTIHPGSMFERALLPAAGLDAHREIAAAYGFEFGNSPVSLAELQELVLIIRRAVTDVQDGRVFVPDDPRTGGAIGLLRVVHDRVRESGWIERYLEGLES